MKLRFYAREGRRTREAGLIPRVGQATRYYGLRFDPEKRDYEATKEPFETELGTEHADKCRKACRKGDLWAADEQTAAASGAVFVATEFKDGAHVARAKPAAKASSSKGAES